MALDDDQWLTEICKEGGSAFSFRLTEARCLHSEQTEYQKLEVYDTQNYGRVMMLDGFVMLSSRDNFLYHEMMTHPVLFSHADPREVLIIGGGDCGTLREVLRHDCVTRATQVDIDERVTRVSEQFFPELCEANADPRAQLAFEDGIRWVNRAKDASLDVVIVDSTDPIGPAEGLFSREFFRQVHRVLRPGGLMVQQSESPLYHLDQIIRPMHDAMRDSGFTDIRTLPFAQPVYPSGWWSATLAARDGEIGFARAEQAAAKAFPTEYYNADIHRASLVLPEFMRRRLAG